MFVMVAVSSSVTAACSVELSASPFELSDTCCEPFATSSATRCMLLTVVDILFSNSTKESLIPLKSPCHSTCGSTAKFPFENSSMEFEISST